MDCNETRGLLPRYLDNELDEAQAAPLRAHLLSCPGCRAVVQDGKALQGWFVPSAPVSVPDGFAARVARRAVAGDAGSGGRGLLVPVVADSSAREEVGRSRLDSFLLTSVAVAALLLLALSIGLRRLDMPDSSGLSADDSSKSSAIEALKDLNEDEDEAEADK